MELLRVISGIKNKLFNCINIRKYQRIIIGGDRPVVSDVVGTGSNGGGG